MHIARGGVGRAAPAFATLFAALLLGTFKCPSTQRTRRALGSVCGRRWRSGHCRATSWKSVNIYCNEPVKGERSRCATSKFSRKTQRSVASLAPSEESALRAPSRAPTAFASKTSACRLKDFAL